MKLNRSFHLQQFGRRDAQISFAMYLNETI